MMRDGRVKASVLDLGCVGGVCVNTRCNIVQVPRCTNVYHKAKIVIHKRE